ncbi:MAG TPA: thioredoxin family protein [Gemmatimonadales bacterium]|nr:thioredoxin family protein [Gemmatimonadales bacterium]
MTASIRATAAVLVLSAALRASPSSATNARDASPAIQWLHDETVARAQSRAMRKPLLIDFRADWCAACTMLDRLTWADPAVRAVVATRYVPLQLDLTAEDDAAAEVMKRYAVSSLPTVLADRQRITGFIPANEMLSVLKGASTQR